ncbi:MAG: acetoin dehydrogenase dihydrolipoyllysine-residue acetyltransferase subunit [Gammaproteobacteria bacterium]|nr:acetoin dehydrogenase dihydrolipoyllysine-residue acetyltransferase subunit [Gammaproteobacteria bacterium]
MSHEETLIPVVIPKWGFSMVEGKVLRWLKQPGDVVAADEDLVEIESEKVVNVLGAPGSGILRRQLAGPEVVAPVGDLIGVIAAEGINDTAIDVFITDFRRPEAAGHVSYETAETALQREMLLDGKWIAYLDAGSGETAVVFLHGLGGSAASWALNQPLLAAHCRTIAIDLPGHGASMKDFSVGSLAELSRIVTTLLDRLGIADAHLVAHSFGTLIAVELALTIPHRVATLTLISGLGAGTRFDHGFIDDFLGANKRRELAAVLTRLYANPDFVTRDLVQRVLQTNRIDGVRECLRDIVARCIVDEIRQDPIHNLNRVTMPVQVLWGRDDTIAPPELLSNLPARIPVVFFERVAHMPQIEAAAAVNRMLLRHILQSDD